MRLRTVHFVVVLAVMLAGAALPGEGAARIASPTICRATAWCTITSYGESNAVAAQFAIGNVRRGTHLAITDDEVSLRQVGGEILDGSLAGTCAWSQYQRDWAPIVLASVGACAAPAYLNSQFIAAGGTAIWSGCYSRCWGGVPLRYDRRCGRDRSIFCYRRNCEEYANFYPWTPDAHPTDPVRSTAGHLLDIRYQARYDAHGTHTPYYLVRDQSVTHGRADWVFVSGRACGVAPGPTGSYHHWPPHLK